MFKPFVFLSLDWGLQKNYLLAAEAKTPQCLTFKDRIPTCCGQRKSMCASSSLPKMKWHARLHMEISATLWGTVLFPCVTERSQFSSRGLEAFHSHTEWEALPDISAWAQVHSVRFENLSFCVPSACCSLSSRRWQQWYAWRVWVCAGETWSSTAFTQIHLRVVPSVGEHSREDSPPLPFAKAKGFAAAKMPKLPGSWWVSGLW